MADGSVQILDEEPVSMAEAENEEAIRARLIRWFTEAEEGNRKARELAERDQDYYDNKQLTQDEVNALEQRGQPAISINLIRRKIDFLRGMEVKQRSDPKAWPRTPADGDAAEIATDTLRYVFDAAKYNLLVRKRVWKDLIVVGWCGVEMQAKPTKRDPLAERLGVQPNPRIIFKRTPWDRMFWDPHSEDHDFSDARYRGLVLWMDEADALAMYRGNPKAQQVIKSSLDRSSRSMSFDDKPKSNWVDASRKRVRIVQIWWKEADEVYWAEVTEAGILDGGPSPWVNDEGDPCDPYIWQSCYVDRDNNRCGIVRDMIDPQDEVNKRRSKSLHLLSVKQVIADEGAIADGDIEKAKRQLARPDGWITKTPGLELDIIQNADLSAGQMQLLQHATMELEKMGPNEALQGTGSATSGRDRQAQQQGGLIELGPTMDDLMWIDARAYMLAWAAIQRHWTAPQFIRITDNEDAPRFVGLNEPMVDAQGNIAGMRNQPAEINADIIIQPAPDVISIQQEVWTDFTTLIPILSQLPPQWAELAIQMSPLPSSEKRRLSEILKQTAQQGQPQPDPMQLQMAQRAAMAEVIEKESNALLKQAQAQKAGAEAMAAGRPEAPQGPALTPLDMQKFETERARTAATWANVDKTKADTQARMAATFKTVVDARRPPVVNGNGAGNQA